jgi:hypothetical protein
MADRMEVEMSRYKLKLKDFLAALGTVPIPVDELQEDLQTTRKNIHKYMDKARVKRYHFVFVYRSGYVGRPKLTDICLTRDSYYRVQDEQMAERAKHGTD